MATHEQIKAAGGSDVGDFGEKDMTDAYPPGTEFDTGSSKVKFSELHDVVGKSSGSSKPAK